MFVTQQTLGHVAVSAGTTCSAGWQAVQVRATTNFRASGAGTACSAGSRRKKFGTDMAGGADMTGGADMAGSTGMTGSAGS